MTALTVRPVMNATGARSLRDLAARTRTTTTSVRRLTQVALLHKKFQDLGGATGAMGWPMTVTAANGDGSVARTYEGGELRIAAADATIYKKERQFTVHFVGLECMRESSHDQGTPSDEPYVMWFVQSGSYVSPSDRVNFSKINTGSKRGVTGRHISGLDNRVGVPFTINAIIVEWDTGNRAESQKAVNAAIRDFVGAVNEVADQVNNYQGSNTVQRLPAPLNMPIVEGVIAKVLGLEDDPVGSKVIEVFTLVPGETPEQFDARIGPQPVIGQFEGQSYSHMTEIVGNPEGRYRLYFRIDIVELQDAKPV